jgi:hypothetical protein
MHYQMFAAEIALRQPPDDSAADDCRLPVTIQRLTTVTVSHWQLEVRVAGNLKYESESLALEAT